MAYRFYNPYNFVSAPVRDLGHEFCGDHDPSDPSYEEDHSCYWARRYTGTIPVVLKAQTPLFITDPESKHEVGEGSGHFCYDCLDHIPSTALKGMLSSAYEIITNSRFRVFNRKQHEKRLGYRSPARAALVPGMVSVKDNGQMCVKLLTGTSKVTDSGAEGPLYAAWLPMRSRDIDKVKTGYYEEVELELFSYQGRFDFWSVKSVKDVGASFSLNSDKYIPKNIPPRTFRGFVYRSGYLINNKHYERFLFCEGEPAELEISDEVRDRYEELILDYQNAHKELGGKRINPPNNCELGEHITDSSRLTLRDGDVVFVKTSGGGRKIVDLYPVQISRELGQASPWDCLDGSLKPAEEMSQLSPADRLFGWVSQGRPSSGGSAWRGKVRIGGSEFVAGDDGPSTVERFSEPLPLSILGGPKPAQARFYLGDKDGRPQRDGISKDAAAYTRDKRLRGRKVYLHHTLHFLSKEQKTSYWDPASNDKIIAVREYARYIDPDKILTNQNRSITGWIPKGRVFKFEISFENLTEAELGALLALLTLSEEQCYFRLGFAKPLGLGSVRLGIDWDEENSIPVCTGAVMADRYKTLSDSNLPRLGKAGANRIIQAYQRAMVSAYGAGGAIEEDKAVSDLPWERDPARYEFMGYADDAQIAAYAEVWRSALDELETLRKIPKDPQPPKEGQEWLEEIAAADPEADVFKKLQEDLYVIANERAKRRKDDFGWGKLSFIAELKQSMKGVEDPIHYPRSSLTDDREGFVWFVDNERESTAGGSAKTRPGFSLHLLSENGEPAGMLEGF